MLIICENHPFFRVAIIYHNDVLKRVPKPVFISRLAPYAQIIMLLFRRSITWARNEKNNVPKRPDCTEVIIYQISSHLKFLYIWNFSTWQRILHGHCPRRPRQIWSMVWQCQMCILTGSSKINDPSLGKPWYKKNGRKRSHCSLSVTPPPPKQAKRAHWFSEEKEINS